MLLLNYMCALDSKTTTKRLQVVRFFSQYKQHHYSILLCSIEFHYFIHTLEYYKSLYLYIFFKRNTKEDYKEIELSKLTWGDLIDRRRSNNRWWSCFHEGLMTLESTWKEKRNTKEGLRKGVFYCHALGCLVLLSVLPPI